MSPVKFFRTRREARTPREKRSRRVNIILVLVLIAGLVMLFCPTASAYLSGRSQGRAIARYEDAVARMTDEEISSLLAEAEDYNNSLYAAGSPVMLADPDRLEGYWEILDITGTGMIGYITIEGIDVCLPVYHGTSEETLAAGAGHLQGSSLPVGGENTHSVISGHRGLRGKKLFEDLDKLETGDVFTVTVLDREYRYEVEEITVIEPTEWEALFTEPGEDYCTLMTCAPAGSDEYRLLVRGTRVDDSTRGNVAPGARQIGVGAAAALIAVPLFALWLIILYIRNRGKKTGGNSV